MGNKANQRWLWYAIDHAANTLLAYVLGKRQDEVFQTLKALLEPYPIVRYYTDNWGLINVIWILTSMKSANVTLKKSNVKT